jgi:hypothetical protein
LVDEGKNFRVPGAGASHAMSQAQHEAGHALVVGGTGMLRGLVLGLAEIGWTVSVVARRAGRLTALRRSAQSRRGHVWPVAQDYRDEAGLRKRLAEALDLHGPVSLAVCWIHSPVAGPLGTLVDCLRVHAHPCRLFHLLGSVAQNPTRPVSGVSEMIDAAPWIRYREVILGFKADGRRSRWLLDEEVAGGIMEAILRDARRTVIGTVEPWSARP